MTWVAPTYLPNVSNRKDSTCVSVWGPQTSLVLFTPTTTFKQKKYTRGALHMCQTSPSKEERDTPATGEFPYQDSRFVQSKPPSSNQLESPILTPACSLCSWGNGKQRERERKHAACRHVTLSIRNHSSKTIIFHTSITIYIVCTKFVLDFFKIQGYVTY